jgi:hypothetical protein
MSTDCDSEKPIVPYDSSFELIDIRRAGLSICGRVLAQRGPVDPVGS